jgi:hypothetical protein
LAIAMDQLTCKSGRYDPLVIWSNVVLIEG